MKHVFMAMSDALEKVHTISTEATTKFLTHVAEPFSDYTAYPAAMRVRSGGATWGLCHIRGTRSSHHAATALSFFFFIVQETQRFRDLMQLYKEVRFHLLSLSMCSPCRRPLLLPAPPPLTFNRRQQDAVKEIQDRRAELAKESSSDQRTSVAAIFGKDPEAVKKEKVDRLTAIVDKVRTTNGRRRAPRRSLSRHRFSPRFARVPFITFPFPFLFQLEKAVEYNINRSDKMNAHMRAEFERLEEYKALELRHCYRQWADLEAERYARDFAMSSRFSSQPVCNACTAPLCVSLLSSSP